MFPDMVVDLVGYHDMYSYTMIAVTTGKYITTCTIRTAENTNGKYYKNIKYCSAYKNYHVNLKNIVCVLYR